MDTIGNNAKIMMLSSMKYYAVYIWSISKHVLKRMEIPNNLAMSCTLFAINSLINDGDEYQDSKYPFWIGGCAMHISTEQQ